MKNKILLASLVSLSILSSAVFAEETVSSPNAHIKRKKKVVTTPAATTESNSSAVVETAPAAPSTPKHFAFGFQTLDGSIGASDVALSGLIELAPATSMQVFAAIGSTSPFQFGVGGAVRHTVVGNEKAGMHVGGLLGLGTMAAGSSSTLVAGKVVTESSTKFFVNIAGLAGVHFQVPSVEKVMISFDGGPTLRIFDGNTNFSMGGFSPMAGLGIHYFLN